MLKITLAGVPGSGKAALAAALTTALEASNCQAAITLNATAALAPDLANEDLVLLMGLTTDARRAGQAQAALEEADQRIRSALNRSGVAYQVLYGLNRERLGQALHACTALGKPGKPVLKTEKPSLGQAISKQQLKNPAWVWLCDSCSDPVCEHRLLTDLLARRSAGEITGAFR